MPVARKARPTLPDRPGVVAYGVYAARYPITDQYRRVE